MYLKLNAIHKDANPFVLGVFVGVLLIAWMGFEFFGWKTGAATERLGKKQAETAVIASQAKICSVQFNAAKNLTIRMEELQKVDRWSRAAVITKSGFATMVSEKEPTSGVAEACAILLIPEPV
jgi:hypothetical protein